MSGPPPRHGARLLALLLVIVVLGLAAFHLVAFHIVSPRLAVPAGLGVAVVALALAVHLGLLGVLGLWLRRKFHGE